MKRNASPGGNGFGPASARTLLFVYAGFIVYGTLIPFDYCDVPGCLGDNVSRIAWIPFLDPDGSRASFSDIVQNVLFFLPLGFFGLLASRGKKLVSLFAVTLAATAFSGLVESIQLTTVDRTTSATDIVTNTAGGFAGALLALLWLRTGAAMFTSPRHGILRGDSGAFLWFTAFAVVSVGSLHPFDFALDPVQIAAELRAWWHLSSLAEEFSGDELTMALRYAVFAGISVAWFRTLGSRGSWLAATVACCAIGILLEIAQLIVQSRSASMLDVLVLTAGALCGATIVGVKSKSAQRGAWPYQWALAIVILSLIGATLQNLAPFDFNQRYTAFNWIPFVFHYERTTPASLSNMIDTMLVYFPIAFVLQLSSRRQRAYIPIAMFCFGFALVIEFAQGWVIGRYPDISDAIGAAIGAVLASRAAIRYATLRALESASATPSGQSETGVSHRSTRRTNPGAADARGLDRYG